MPWSAASRAARYSWKVRWTKSMRSGTGSRRTPLRWIMCLSTATTGGDVTDPGQSMLEALLASARVSSVRLFWVIHQATSCNSCAWSRLVVPVVRWARHVGSRGGVAACRWRPGRCPSDCGAGCCRGPGSGRTASRTAAGCPRGSAGGRCRRVGRVAVVRNRVTGGVDRAGPRPTDRFVPVPDQRLDVGRSHSLQKHRGEPFGVQPAGGRSGRPGRDHDPQVGVGGSRPCSQSRTVRR